MNFTIECEEELDGRWLAEVADLPGVLAYGKYRVRRPWSVPKPFRSAS